MAMDNMEESTMNDMMEEIEKSMSVIHSGEIVKGKVISVTDSEAFIDISYRADGIISRDELSDDGQTSPKDILKVDDVIEVYIVKVNDGEGNVTLSKKRVDAVKVWDELDEAFKNGTTLTVKVKEVVKGGVVAFIKGIRAFIPASQLSVKFVEDLNAFVGKELEVKVLEFDKSKKKIILSRKEIEKVEVEKKKQEVWDSIEVGQKRSGVVTRLAKFGAFVDLGGVDGLIHISELSWKRVNDPSEVVSAGDNVEVYVLGVDKEKGKLSLGLKDVNDNPWNNISAKYKEGDIVTGRVARMLDFGAFVELAPGLDGLVHISRICDKHIAKPSEVLNIGEEVKVKILEINEEQKKVSLSIKDAVEKVEETSNTEEYVQEEEKITLGDELKEKNQELDAE